MKSFMKLYFFKILGALGWQHAEKPLCVNVNGQPLLEIFLCVNDGTPFPVPPSRLEGAIDYLESVVLGKRTHKVLALVPGRMRVASEITTARDLRNSLQQGHVINMVSY